MAKSSLNDQKGPLVHNLKICVVQTLRLSYTDSYNQATGPELGTKKTWTGTNHQEQNLPGPGPIIGTRNYWDRDWSQSRDKMFSDPGSP